MGSKLTIDASGVLENLERAATGSAVSFYRLSQQTLEPVLTEARSAWPVRSGASKASLRVVAGSQVGQLRQAISAGPTGTGWPAFKITWSKMTTEARERRITEAAARTHSPEAATQVRNYMRAKLSRRGVEPPPGMAGRQPWHWLIRQPAKAAAVPLAALLEDDLVALARGVK